MSNCSLYVRPCMFDTFISPNVCKFNHHRNRFNEHRQIEKEGPRCAFIRFSLFHKCPISKPSQPKSVEFPNEGSLLDCDSSSSDISISSPESLLYTSSSERPWSASDAFRLKVDSLLSDSYLRQCVTRGHKMCKSEG